MPPKRRASELPTKLEPALQPGDAVEQGEVPNPMRMTEKQPKIEKPDSTTEFSEPLHHTIKRESSPVKPEPRSDQKTAVKGSRTFLSVPVGEKEIAKAHGALWDATVQRWYVLNEWIDFSIAARIGFYCLPDLQPLRHNGWDPQPPPAFTEHEMDLCMRWASGDPDLDAEFLAHPREIVSQPSTVIPCKYQDKDKVKALGALWDGTDKVWYVQNAQVNVESPSSGYFLHPINKLLFSPWLQPVHALTPPAPSQPSPSQPASPNSHRKLNVCPIHSIEVQVLAASKSGKLYEKCPVPGCQAELPGTKAGLWRWHSPHQRNVCPVHGIEVKDFQVKNGMEHNVGRWFEKCPVHGCTAQLPGTDVGLWRWSDGSLPFSRLSQERFERYHGLYGGGCPFM
jgi:hypothetical protein